MGQLEKLLRGVWEFLREACGENDYYRYRTQALSRGEQPVAPEDYYLEKLRHKYSCPKCCC